MKQGNKRLATQSGNKEAMIGGGVEFGRAEFWTTAERIGSTALERENIHADASFNSAQNPDVLASLRDPGHFDLVSIPFAPLVSGRTNTYSRLR